MPVDVGANDYDMPEGSDQSQELLKKRSSKACDHCRLMKIKCERSSIDQDCDRCTDEGLVCTSETPSRRRGPPKGYLNLVENRVHGLEAIIGVLLSNPNPAIRSTFGALNQDPFASDVISQVANGPFGPRAIANYADQRRASEQSSSSNRQRSPQDVATNEWQLQAVQTMIANSSSGNLPPPSNGLHSHPPFGFTLTQVPGETQTAPQPPIAGSQAVSQPSISQAVSQPSTSQDRNIQPPLSEPVGDFSMGRGWNNDFPFSQLLGDAGQDSYASGGAPWY